DIYRASIARASVRLIQRVDELLAVTWTQPAPATPETVTFSVSPAVQVIAYRPPALMKLGGAIHTIGWFPTRTSGLPSTPTFQAPHSVTRTVVARATTRFTVTSTV